MTIAEKLTLIAQNEQKVYNAGYAKGKSEGGSTSNGTSGDYSEGLWYLLLSDDTYQVTGIGTCTDTDIIIPSKYNGKAVTTIDYGAFEGEYGDGGDITSVIIPNSVKTIGVFDAWMGAFENCRKLQNVFIGNSVETIGAYSFEDCKSLTSIVIPNSVEEIGENAFLGCTNLLVVTMGRSVRTIGSDTAYEGVFGSCTNLIRVDFSKHTFVPTLLEDCTFNNTSTALEIIVPVNLIDEWKSATNWSIWADKIVAKFSQGLEYSLAEDDYEYDWYDGYVVTGIGDCADTDIIIPSSYNGQPVTVIGSGAFSFESITSVTIPDSVEHIGEYAFDYTELKSAIIGKNVNVIDEYAFNECTNLIRVDFSRHTFVPTLSDANAFDGTDWELQIKVPANLINQWKTATNWSIWADNIVTEFTEDDY